VGTEATDPRMMLRPKHYNRCREIDSMNVSVAAAILILKLKDNEDFNFRFKKKKKKIQKQNYENKLFIR
jgi:hypothetical protein